ncbi:hypothetical protein VE03_05626 [Pseudogymnoascus sp. 23342-1-I1]|nr:hypothetical protein VE03_05626 [Pseudogymnoascus sp. 23342-1-I1]
MANILHPFTPLSGPEIESTAKVIQAAQSENAAIRFKGITLREPAKESMQKYLIDEKSGALSYALPRKALVNYYVKGTNHFFESIVNLDEKSLERNIRVADGLHGPVDDGEVVLVEKIVLEDPAVQEEIKKLQLPAGSVVVCDPWIWGADGVDGAKRQYQCYLYVRDPSNSTEEDGNHYAYPLAISPVVDTVTLTVTKIDFIPTGTDFSTSPTKQFRAVKPNEYIPSENKLRTDLKELQVLQPNGASFTVEGDVIRWQKWEFRLGFNSREGMVLYGVSYDQRPLFYRVSLSDMSIPYADPRGPVHKKQAFDLGDSGAGMMANDLKLGCDCLGSIYYKDGLIADEDGKPMLKKNAVCIHEQDYGIGWKHTNYRTGRAAVVRNRELVLQSIITVSNYEYILAFVFNQAGDFSYEVRATGILSTQPIDEGISVPWGTVVHDGVLAAHHQHIFSLRINPELDGSSSNSLVYEEAHAMPIDPATNPFGNGYVSTETLVENSVGLDLDSRRNRVFKITNPNKHNAINGKAVSYKVVVPPFQPILANPNSVHYKRAEFADHSIYVTKYREDELFSGGQYTNQSQGGHGVRSWAARNDSVVEQDIVLWVQFGLQHIPRAEDFPVMPCELIKVSLKPVNFFERNPAIDVPPSTQDFNKSTNLRTEAVVGLQVKDDGCCSVTEEQKSLPKL